MSTQNWQTDHFRVVESYLTGQKIYINDDLHHFLIPPTFSPNGVKQALDDLDVFLTTCTERRQPSKALQKAISGLRAATTAESFGLALDNLLADRPDAVNATSDPARLRDVLVRLWQAGCLVWPINITGKLGLMKLSEAWGWGQQTEAMLAAFNSRQGKSSSNNSRLRAFMILILSRGDVRQVADLTPDVTNAYFESQMRASTLRHSTAAILLSLQEAAYGDRIAYSLADFGRFGRPSIRTDDAFAWSTSIDPSLEHWRALAEEFMKVQTGGVEGRRGGLNTFLDYLIANPSLQRLPESYLRSGYEAVPPFKTTQKTIQNALVEFFDHILDTQCVDEDDYGNKVRVPGFRNPLTPVRGSANNGETHRSPMPTRFVRMLHDILTEHDFAWPKAAGRNTRGAKVGRGDWFTRINPETGESVEVWSPVRTVAILIKLLLPPRTFQVRVLDSGEGDSEIYRPNQGWVRNTGPLAPSVKTNFAKGVLHRHYDQESRTEKTFLYFNTNKTADLSKEASDAGFVMPWEHQEAIALLAWLRDWQEKNNPLTKPTQWSDISEVNIRSRFTKEALVRRGKACFLFRDPVAREKDQPVTDARLNGFWKKLCAELEHRLAAAGETLHDGSPIVLVARRENGDYGVPLFDLHSLRVTIITALAESGGVPAEMLMKVVGHASVVMTIYYEKISVMHISERLNAAGLSRQNDEQANWQRWLLNKDRETLLKAVAFVEASGVDAMLAVSPTSWVDREHGICPVGCSRCHEGGEKLVDTTAYERWGAVPGGPSNCVRCRFFITGPVFLNGLNAHFDNISFRLREASARYRLAKTKYENLEAEYNTARERGEPFPKSKTVDLELASGLYDEQTKAVDEVSLSWNAAFRLIQRCMEILRRTDEDCKGDKGAFALVAVGGLAGLEVALEETTEFELVDRICQAAVFYEGIDPTLPNLKRMRAFDAMLARNGYDPVFVNMSEADALAVGNQMAAYLYTRRGRDNTNALVEGRETLRRLGIEQEFVSSLESVAPVRILRRSRDSARLERQVSTFSGGTAA